MSRLFKESPFPGGSPGVEVFSPAPAPRERPDRGRFWFAAGVFALAFAGLGLRMGQLAFEGEAEPPRRVAQAAPADPRAPILDREGRVLASTLETWEVFIRPRAAAQAGGVSPDALDALKRIFPKLDLVGLRHELANRQSNFAWIARRASPEQWRRARDLGIIGVEAAPREDRVYPAGRTVAHVLGGVNIDNIGVAGVEAGLDDVIADPLRGGEPLRLSIDLRVQTALRRTLQEAKSEFAAPGAAGLLMDVRSGELLALVSLPDFDPNDRPDPPRTRLEQARSPLFNKATQGSYELGSIFKLLTAAMALETGVATPDTVVNASRPIRRGGRMISDYLGEGRPLTLTEVVKHSSNIGAVLIAERVGREAQQDYFRRFGFYDRVPMPELPLGERSPAQPPAKWGPAEAATVSYGHGIAVSPLHLATAIASVVNDGCRVTPTLLRRAAPETCDRVVSLRTSKQVRAFMRIVAEQSSGRNANIPGYEVGGKTGTAYKVREDQPGYYLDKRFNSFLAVWPAPAPRYLLMVSLDDPKLLDGSRRRPLAGHTAAPTAGRAIERIAPLLGAPPRTRFPEFALRGEAG